MTIDVHGQFRGSVSGEGLGFLNSDAAFNNQVDICFADGVKVYLAARPLVVNLFDEPQHRVCTMAARLRLWQQQVGDTAPLPGI